VEPLFAFLLPDWHFARGFRWRDVLDVALMTFLIYQAYIRFRGTRAARVGAGLAVLGIFYFLAQAAGLFLTTWVLGGIWAASFILVIVVFRAEIRQILEQVNPLIASFSLFRHPNQLNGVPDFLVTIADTCFTLAQKRCGALLVFERRDPVEPLLRGKGVVVDAYVSSQLVENLCTPPTPLHDGALYLREGRVYRASCILPLSETLSLPYFYGTRHRAAVGITEHSDAVSVVVSEERGEVSVVEQGSILTLPGPRELVAWLTIRLSYPLEKQGVWLDRTLITHNWRAKLGALTVVGVLWLMLVGPQNTEVGFTIPVVYYDIPVHFDLEGKRTQEVYLRVRGSRELLSLLDPSRLRAQIDLKEAKEGTSGYSLSAQEVNLPLGLQVAGVDPPVVTVTLKKKPLPEKLADKAGPMKDHP